MKITNVRVVAMSDGQWIQYDVGTTAMISEVAIAWAQGDRRTASFALHVSSDGNSW
ncbi:alginate lyase, partial [Candidatus Entotheonella serta]